MRAIPPKWLYESSGARYRQLSQTPRNPLAAQLTRQQRSRQRFSVMSASLLWTLPVAAAAAFGYSRLDAGMFWTLPLWLMLWSVCPCALWLSRIVALLSRQSSAGVLDEISVIPPGRGFVCRTVCQLVLSADDAAWWLGLLRRGTAALALAALLLALCMALALSSTRDVAALGGLLLDLALLLPLFPLEGAQSALIVCMLGVHFGTRPPTAVEPVSAAFALFMLLQALSLAVPMAAAILLGVARPWLIFALFLLIRELAIAICWHRVMGDET